MKPKIKYILFAGVLLFFAAFQLNLLFSIQAVAASDSYSPQNTDFAMSSNVDLSNLSIYQVDNGNITNANLTAMSQSGIPPSTSTKLLMFLPEAQILSGSSPQAVLYTYNHLKTNTMTSLFNNNIPVITSYSARGYSHINYLLFNNYVGPIYKIDSVNSLNSLQSIQQFSTIMANRYSIMNLYSLSTNFSNSDFNDAIGAQGTQSIKFTDSNIMKNANTTVYDNLNNDSFNGDVDPNFYSTYMQWNQTVSTGYVTDQQINPNANKDQTQQTFFAGYNNFEYEAIDTPVKDFAIQSLASQEIYLTANQLMVNYTSINDVSNNHQMSPALRNHLMDPLNKTSSNPYGLVHINFLFLGYKFFSVNRVDPAFVANAWGFSMPSVNLNSIVNGAVNTVKSAVSNPGNLATTAIDTASKFAKDSASAAVNAVFHLPSTINNLGKNAASSIGGAVSWTSHAFGSAVNAIGKPLADAGKYLINNNPLNPKSWFGNIFSTVLNFLKPYLPYIAIVLGVVLLGVMAYFFLPKIVGGIIMKKH